MSRITNRYHRAYDSDTDFRNTGIFTNRGMRKFCHSDNGMYFEPDTPAVHTGRNDSAAGRDVYKLLRPDSAIYPGPAYHTKADENVDTFYYDNDYFSGRYKNQGYLGQYRLFDRYYTGEPGHNRRFNRNHRSEPVWLTGQKVAGATMLKI